MAGELKAEQRPKCNHVCIFWRKKKKKEVPMLHLESPIQLSLKKEKNIELAQPHC